MENSFTIPKNLNSNRMKRFFFVKMLRDTEIDISQKNPAVGEIQIFFKNDETKAVS